VVVFGTVVFASWFLLAAAAPAADTDLTQAALDARKAVNLPAIGENPAVLAAAGAVLGGGDPQGAFTSAGGTGDLVTATVPAGEALSNDKLKVVVFDPRVTAIAVLGRDRVVAVAAALDPRRPFQGPVLAGAVVDPGVPGSLAVLVPPGSGTIPQISLQRYRGRQLVTIDIAATATPGVEGAILVALKGRDQVTGPQVGYGLTYTLKVGTNRSYTVQTRPIPSAVVSRSFVAGPGFKGADRARFIKTVDSLPPEGKKIVDIIGGTVTASVLANTAPICGAQTSCAGIDPGNGYFLVLNRAQLRSAAGRFVIDHELGHLVDFLGLDSWSHQDFSRLFTRSRNWKKCFPLRGQCSPSLEVFADQFAFYSTNAHGVQSGYGDDRLATSSGFANVLRVQWAFRPPQDINPLAGYGPLAKSFENALHSNEGAL
jgi:hypothetical protein